MADVPKKRGRPRKTDTIVNTSNVPDEEVKAIVKEKRHRNRPDLANFGAERTEPGDNSRFLRFAMASWDLPRIDISDPKQVEKRIQEYFTHCADNDRKPNVVGMANWLGVNRDTLQSWKRGEYRSETHAEIIQRAFSILEEQWVDYMMCGKVNPGSGIFIGKNHFQYTDTQQIVVTPNNPYESGDPDEVKGKYLEDIQGTPIDTDGEVK